MKLTRAMKTIHLLAASAPFTTFVLLAACGGGSDNLPPPPPPPPPAVEAPVVTQPATEPAPAPAPPAQPAVTLTPGAASPDPSPLPTVKVVAPAKGQVIPADKAADFALKLDVKNWATAPGSAHVHVILDGKPYKAVFDPKAPLKLSEIAGAEALSEGEHVLVAFPSRANHESVKTKDALTVSTFSIGKKEAKFDAKKPLLVYSRPKGEYKGDMANHVLIDFQLANVTLAEGKEHVNISVTGTGITKELTAKATAFGTPFYLDNLQNGSYSIKLDLVGADDKPVEGPFNSVTRQITINHDAPMDPAMNHGAPAPATSSAPKAAPTSSAAAPQTKPDTAKAPSKPKH